LEATCDDKALAFGLANISPGEDIGGAAVVLVAHSAEAEAFGLAPFGMAVDAQAVDVDADAAVLVNDVDDGVTPALGLAPASSGFRAVVVDATSWDCWLVGGEGCRAVEDAGDASSSALVR
jgi:hypothetical protein